ncbi:hypothetical protein [Microcoleus sp.]|uniref:hypothetical protein n=1 Tax=Microcoleus sp. TaxID=44472 RepID=UPI00403E36D3
MPVAQTVNFLGWVSILSATGFPACSTKSYFFLWGYILSATGFPACSTKSYFFLDGSTLPT